MVFMNVGLVLAHWSFYLLGVFLWGMMVASGVLFIVGIWKGSWKAFMASGIAFLIPSITLSTQHGWFSLFLLLPILAFALTFYTRRKVKF